MSELVALVALAARIATAHHVDPALFQRMIKAESDWNAKAETACCVGLGQINQEVWGWWPPDPFDPEANLNKAAEILRWNVMYRQHYSVGDPAGQMRLAVASYLLGHKRVNDLWAEYGDAWTEHLSDVAYRYVETVTGEPMPKRVDENQAEIVAVARDMGASVADLHEVGGGMPDLLVAWRGHNLLVEVKADRGTLTSYQVAWHEDWHGPVHVVRSAEEMVMLLQAICCKCGERAEYMHPGRWRCKRCGEIWNGGVA